MTENNSSNRKKVLVITYYWPPSGGIGVHRCLKFVKYLDKLGWDSIVYTASNADYPYLDESNFKDIPQDTVVLKQPIREPFSWYKILSGKGKKSTVSNPIFVSEQKKKWIDEFAIWIRGNFFIPDARALWIKPSVKYLLKYLKTNQIDAIISDGPPHTNTAIACKVSQATGIPWIADFQDPWTQVDYYKLLKLTRWADRKHRKMEQEVFKTASKIIIASPTWKEDIEKIGARNVDVLFWGYDEDDFKEIKKRTDAHTFSIAHLGLLGNDRYPETFLQVIADMVKENELFHQQVKLEFIGQVDIIIKRFLESNNLLPISYLPGNIPRKEALQKMVDTDILLLPLNIADNVKGRLPGKLYEYLRAGNPILALGPANSDAAKIISETQSGLTLEYNNYRQIKQFILDQFNRHLDGTNIHDQGKITEYSVENQVGKLSNFLKNIVC